MTDPRWFEEKPSQEVKARIEHAAERELDRRARLDVHNDRRSFFSLLPMEAFAAIPVAGIAAAIGFWLVTGKEFLSPSSVQVGNHHDDSLDAELPLEAALDMELIENLELLEDIEILEALNIGEITS